MAKPDDIADRCKELGFSHAMITDHQTCSGHIAFYKSCVKAGLVPVLGTELYFKDERYDNGKPKGWHTLIFALNDKGLENVWKISSYTYYATSDGHRIPNARWDMFEGYGEGVVCTSACLAGVMSKAALDDDREMADYWVDRCLATFEDFAIELHTNSMDDQRKANLWLARYAHERGLKTVYAVDAHYVRPEDAEFHDKWLGMATKAYYDQPHWTMDHEYYIQGEDEVRARLAYLGEDEVQKCVECASEILGKVETVTIDGSHKVPHAHLPEGVSDPNAWLSAKACEGLLKKVGGCDTSIKIEGGRPRIHVSNWGGSDPKGVTDKVRPYVRQLEEKEMPLVVDNGLADYFLMVAGYVEFAKRYSLVGPGRGSAAGSVLCYLLGITSIDPMGKGLVFERFLNQGRLGTHVIRFEGGGAAELGEAVRVKVRGRGAVGAGELSPGDFVECRIGWDGKTEDASVSGAVESVEFRGGELPDIDVDFEPDFRSTMQMHLVREYGGDKVTAVGTTMFYGMKSALKDLCRYYRLSMAESNRLTSIMEQVEQMTAEGEDWHSVLALLSDSDRQFVEGYEARYPDLFADADRMVGLCRQQGKHAAGFVMSPVPLAGKLPVRKVCHKDALDDVITQFDKYEVEDLGFVKADVLGLRNLETLHQAADTVFGRTGERIDFYGLPESPDDDAVWGMFERGETLGIFQMESQGLTRVAMQLKPRSVAELSTIIALYRPGVIGAGMLDEYIARATGQKQVEYLAPQLENILGDTFGCIVFQEQSMTIFRELGNFTDTEADRIRAAIGHKKVEQIQAVKPKFLDGCKSNGISEDVANEIFRQIEASGSYSFNLSHSLAYATVSYWTAWMKAHHLVEYYAACLGTVGSDKAQEYMADLRRRGCRVVPPLLESLSKGYAVIDDRTISYGLVNIAGMGGVAIDGVMACAPYDGFSDFVDRSGLNRSQIEKMINGGVFRKVYPDRRDLLLRYRGNDFRPNLFGGELTEEGRMLAVHEPYTDAELIEIETEVYGRPLTVDPYEHMAPQVGERAYREQFTAAQLAALRDGFEGFVMGKVVKVRQHRTKKGDMMAFIGVETQLGESLDVSVFPKMWGIARQWIREGTYGYFGLGKETYNGGPSFHLEHYKYLEL